MKEITEWPNSPYSEQSNTQRSLDKRDRCLELIGSNFYYGEMQIETPAENELVYLLKELGYWFNSEDELIKKLYP